MTPAFPIRPGPSPPFQGGGRRQSPLAARPCPSTPGLHTTKRNTSSCLTSLEVVAKLHGRICMCQSSGWGKGRSGVHMALGGSWPGGFLQDFCCHVLPPAPWKQLPLHTAFLVTLDTSPLLCITLRKPQWRPHGSWSQGLRAGATPRHGHLTGPWVPPGKA